MLDICQVIFMSMTSTSWAYSHLQKNCKEISVCEEKPMISTTKTLDHIHRWNYVLSDPITDTHTQTVALQIVSLRRQMLAL